MVTKCSIICDSGPSSRWKSELISAKQYCLPLQSRRISESRDRREASNKLCFIILSFYSIHLTHISPLAILYTNKVNRLTWKCLQTVPSFRRGIRTWKSLSIQDVNKMWTNIHCMNCIGWHEPDVGVAQNCDRCAT